MAALAMTMPLRVRGLVRRQAQPEPGRREHPIDDRTLSRIRRRLLWWGRRNFQPYPWRLEKDPWLSFAAEFLLQRTRASQVEPVFKELREHFPTAVAFVRAGVHPVRELTDRLGLHWRGPLLANIAKEFADRDGVPPDSMEELCQLTGVGMYTAAAWLSLHRGKRAVILDANICRWLSRMTGLPYNRDPRHVRWVQELADDLTPRRVFRDYNYAALDFTMNVCTLRRPLCDECPLHKDCKYDQASPSHHVVYRRLGFRGNAAARRYGP